jgi:predicted ArsR family transcriptional regulator
MQATRQRILSILKEHDQATVDELSQELGLTAVTVRHHLDILRGEGLVAAPVVHRRKSPGRPQYIYTLTEKSSNVFPKRYDQLSRLILGEVHARLSPDEVDQMMTHIGEQIASQAVLTDEGDFETRLGRVVEFLNRLGYMARWEHDTDGAYLLHIANCPYERVARQDHQICKIDYTLLTRLLGVAPERTQWAAQGENQCAYAIRPPSE